MADVEFSFKLSKRLFTMKEIEKIFKDPDK